MTTMLRLDTFLPYRLNRLAALTSRELSRVYAAEFGLTIPEWRVLATLGDCREASAKAIGTASAMHKTKVSRAVAKLEQRRWLTRRTDARDGRIEHLTLTSAGRKALGHLVPKMLGVEAAILDRLTQEEQKALVKGLGGLERVLASEG